MNDILLKKKNRKNAHTRKRNRNQDKGMVVGKKPLRARVSEARRANGWMRHDLQKNTIVEILWRQNLCVSLWYKKQFVKIVLYARLRC